MSTTQLNPAESTSAETTLTTDDIQLEDNDNAQQRKLKHNKAERLRRSRLAEIQEQCSRQLVALGYLAATAKKSEYNYSVLRLIEHHSDLQRRLLAAQEQLSEVQSRLQRLMPYSEADLQRYRGPQQQVATHHTGAPYTMPRSQRAGSQHFVPNSNSFSSSSDGDNRLSSSDQLTPSPYTSRTNGEQMDYHLQLIESMRFPRISNDLREPL